MGFVERAFTPPGTGGREAAAIQAQADAQAAIAAANARSVPTMPTAPEAPKPAAAPPQFAPGTGPGDKAKSARTATVLGQTAALSQQSRKVSVLG
jgi:hypothetical protein